MKGQILYMVSIPLSVLALAAIAYMYYKFESELSGFREDFKEMERDVESLKIENEAFSEDIEEDLDKDELFEENVRNLAERLFVLLKTKHGMEDVTTYKEMEDVIEEMDAQDEELKEELMDFYESAIRLEYSDDALSETERERMKQTAIDLIKRTGQDLE